MQILIQFYSIIIVSSLLLLGSQKQILRSRFLILTIVLLIYWVMVAIVVEIRGGNVSPLFVMSGFVAKTAFIPAAYVYLRNHFYKSQLAKEDLIHLSPCVIFFAGYGATLLINGNASFLLNDNTKIIATYGDAAALSFQIFISLVTGFYLWLVLKMLKTNHMQFGQNISNSEISPVFSESGNPDKKNGNHPLFFSDERMSHIDSVVREFLTEKKPFLKHGYSLRHLSDDIHVPLHHLSAFINRHYQMNFNDFINEYRVHYCKIKIMNDEWKVKKLEAIAEESGFNNRNTFTSAFKKVTGLNPSEYLKGIKESQKVIEPLFQGQSQILRETA